jgi:hypothetical protein
MSVDESIARLKASRTPFLTQPAQYFWWYGKDGIFAEIQKRVEAIGEEHAIVRAYPGLNEKSEPDIHFVVRDSRAPTKDGDEPLNFSHVCPPWCDNGG